MPLVTAAGRRKTKPFLQILMGSVLAGLVLAGCETTAPVPATPRVQPSFNYTPVETASPGSADITFAVVDAMFDNPMMSVRMPDGDAAGARPAVFEDFARSMAEDFNELILARGYTVRGPFRSHDELTYPEKRGSDLILTATVDFSPNFSGVTYSEQASLAGALADLSSVISGETRREDSDAANVLVSGTITIGTRITLVVSESVTNERMWAKSVNLPPIRTEMSSEHSYPRREVSLENLLARENKFYSDLGRALEAQYEDVMEATWNYLHPDEMRGVKRESLEVRERKVY